MHPLRHLLLGLTPLLFACQHSQYDGPSSPDGFYREAPELYFTRALLGDSLQSHSFGILPSSTQELELELELALAGPRPKEAIQYRIIPELRGGAKLSELLSPLEETYSLAPDSLRSKVRLKLHRAHIASLEREGDKIAVLREGQRVLVDLSKPYDNSRQSWEPQDDDVYQDGDQAILRYDTLTLQLVPLNAGAHLRGGQRLTLYLNNAFTRPTWWSRHKELGHYSDDKMRYLLSFYEGKAETISSNLAQGRDATYEVLLHVERYMKEHHEPIPWELTQYFQSYR